MPNLSGEQPRCIRAPSIFLTDWGGSPAFGFGVSMPWMSIFHPDDSLDGSLTARICT